LDTNQAKATKQQEILAQISAIMDKNLNEMWEDIKSSQAEMRSTLDGSEGWPKRETDCNKATETKLNPG
jgi:hypothetical protein